MKPDLESCHKTVYEMSSLDWPTRYFLKRTKKKREKDMVVNQITPPAEIWSRGDGN